MNVLNKASSQRGFTMLEALGVLAILAMLTSGIIKGVNNISSKMKVSQQREQIIYIIKGLRQIYAGITCAEIGASADTTPKWILTPEQLKKARVYDNNMVVGDKAYHVFGKEMTVTCDPTEYAKDEDGNENEDSAEQPIYVTLSEIPAQVCTQLLDSDWGDDPSTGLISINIQSSDGKSDISVFTWECAEDNPNCHKFPFVKGDVIKACKKMNTMTWAYFL
ncbi:MAG: type II secretion system GspH family protein [Alphaproteobacteria bacterium]|nr:type II secretion system GspH family protein [Alphaproteobacteria bacterium]